MKMLPVGAPHYATYSRRVNAILLGQLRVCHVPRTNLQDLLISKNSPAGRFPNQPSRTPAIGHVAHIVTVRPQNQVPRVYTWLVVTPVANVQPVWDFAAVDSKTEPVSGLDSSPVTIAEEKFSIAIHGCSVDSSEWPALCVTTAIDSAPEPCDCFFVHELPLLGLASDVSASRGQLDWMIS